MCESFKNSNNLVKEDKYFPKHYKPYVKEIDYSNPNFLNENYFYFHDFYYNSEWYRFVLYGSICYEQGYNFINLSKIKNLTYDCNYVSTDKTLVKKVRMPITEMEKQSSELFESLLPYFVKYYELDGDESVIDYEIEQELIKINGLTNK